MRDGRIEIVPKSWEKTFFNWMENIQPWCVSRASCGGGTGFRLGMGRTENVDCDVEDAVFVAEAKRLPTELRVAIYGRWSITAP